MDSVRVKVGKLRDFRDAQEAAWAVARDKLGPRAVLWSWHDPNTGRHSPPVECCGDNCDKPAWEAYALTRGGNLKIQIENGGYEFFFGIP